MAIWMMVKLKKVIVMMTTALPSSPVWEAAHGNPDPLEDTVARELVHDQGSFHLKTKSGDLFEERNPPRQVSCVCWAQGNVQSEARKCAELSEKKDANIQSKKFLP